MKNLEQAKLVLRGLFAIHEEPKNVVDAIARGGPGSGHFGHAGRTGEVGGSEAGTGGGGTPKPGGGGGGGSESVGSEGGGKDYTSMHLGEIARDIRRDWGSKVNFAAKPYLEAMQSLDSISDQYGADSGRSIVAYFLSNASSWKGETAKAVKKELNKRLKG